VSLTTAARRWTYRTFLRRRRLRNWVVQEDAAEPDPLPEFRLFAIMATFAEGDIVSATVANALTQGCEAVYVMDNGSPDDTVANAEAAGATIVEEWVRDRHDEAEMRARLHEHAARLTRANDAEHAWWLTIDADEFPKGPDGLTVRDYLAGLDRRHRVVGARFYNHLPTGSPQYLSGFHPAEFQPECYLRTGPHCALRHFKHPLLRYDRDGPALRLGAGQHRVVDRAGSRDPIVEPTSSLVVQHFQWRDETATRRRLEALAPRWADDVGDTRAAPSVANRLVTVEAVYRMDWDHVVDDATRKPGITLHPFRELVPPSEATIRRWYSDADLEHARRAATA
jgi:Glycosyl transferase family 2